MNAEADRNKFDDMNMAQLVQQRDLLNEIIEERREDEETSFLDQMRKEAESRGIDFDKITGSAKKGSNGRKSYTVKPKYRNPKDSSQTWTGRGRKPKWVEAELESGTKLDDLLIEKS